MTILLVYNHCIRERKYISKIVTFSAKKIDIKNEYTTPKKSVKCNLYYFFKNRIRFRHKT